MKSIAKNFGKLNQLVGEKLAGASKQQISEDIKNLEEKTEARKLATGEICDALETYIKTLEKKKEAIDKAKHLAVETLGLAMLTHGSELSDDSSYGQALLKVGEAEQKIGIAQYDFTTRVKDDYLKTLQNYMAIMKTYKHLKGKLNNRRLDYDAKLNRNQKSKKEKPEWEEELRTAQMKYEETLSEIENVMISLNSQEDEQCENLIAFLDAQYEYHRNVSEILYQCKSIVNDPNVKGNRIENSRKSQSQYNDDQQYETPQRRPQTSGSSVSTTHSSINNAQPRPPFVKPSVQQAHQRLVRANYSFRAENAQEMDINDGDIIVVLDASDPGWWYGECSGRKGLFPANYCQDA